MKSTLHQTAKASHYNKDAEHYDAFNEKNSEVMNTLLEKILKNYDIQTVLDLTCGTGSQVFWLTQAGFQVIGADINARMLRIARKKAQEKQLNIKFIKGDIRTLHVGTFDAVISMFNAVGHLTKNDFEQAMHNVHRNLKEGGLYIFDIFNLSYFLKDDHITRLTIDWQKRVEDILMRDIQWSTINHEGVLASFTLSYVQKGTKKPKVAKSAQTLQIYTAAELQEILARNGFKILQIMSIEGSTFDEHRTERMLIVAQKK